MKKMSAEEEINTIDKILSCNAECGMFNVVYNKIISCENCGYNNKKTLSCFVVDNIEDLGYDDSVEVGMMNWCNKRKSEINKKLIKKKINEIMRK